VHGGPKLRQHCLIDEQVLHQLDAALTFAPLHTPAALSVIRFAREHFPALPQIVCFDTTFHVDLPDVARASDTQGIAIRGYSAVRLSTAFPANPSCINLVMIRRRD
jgi:acetate kinase